MKTLQRWQNQNHRPRWTSS